MKKEIKIDYAQLCRIFSELGGNVAPATDQISIDAVYIASYSLTIDSNLYETFCAVSNNKNINELETITQAKDTIKKDLQEQIGKKRRELDLFILKNKKVINDFFETVQNETEERQASFNEKRINSFWHNLNGGPYGGGKDFLLYVMKNICTYNPKSSYKSNVFLNPINAKPLIFDKGAMSYICARPSAGKTTALINIALDGLHQDKKVIYFTAEESIEQITVKLIKNQFYYETVQEGKAKSLPKNKLISSDTQGYFKERIKYLYSLSDEGIEDLQRRVKGQSNDQDLIDNYIMKSINYINEKAQSEQIQIVMVSLLADFEDLKKQISLQDPETIVLIDYIQKLPIPQSALNYNQAYTQIKNIVNELSSVVRDNNLIGIAGAQMGRDTDKGKNEQLLSMAYIRECGDIENDATLCIGIGINKDTRERFYNVMKARNGEYDEKKTILLNDNYGYSYVRTAGTLKDNGYFEMTPYNSKKKKKDDIDLDEDEN